LHKEPPISPADYADSRRQKTGWGNGSAKADAQISLTKTDTTQWRQCCSCCFAVCLRYLRVSALSAGDNACSFRSFSLFFPYVFKRPFTRFSRK